jgi:1-acyl-sn-glycerol-3-phosphate acyltransferase
MSAAMNAPTALDTAVPPRDRRRALRYLVRTPFLLLHLAVSLPLVLLAINPLGAAIKLPGGERLDHRMTRWWQATLMRIFGFRVVGVGTPVPGPVLLVANHLSWADIELIHSQRMACFVAKSEIAGWPVIGWLASRAGTIYHRRGSPESLASVGQVMAQRLRSGLAVAVFPEGGTGPGDHVRTFHARIFQAAIDAQVPAQPVALRFSRDGRLVTDIAFRPGEKFFTNFFRLLGGPPTRAEVIFCEPVPASGDGRRRMAETARARIVDALGVEDRRRAAAAEAAGEPPSDDLDPLANGSNAPG